MYSEMPERGIVTHDQLENAAKHFCVIQEMAVLNPALAERINGIRNLLGEAANAYAKGDKEKSTDFYWTLKSECASLISGNR